MPDAGAIFLGKGGDISQLLLSAANRHGMIAGATGTGKTATLRVLVVAQCNHNALVSR